MSSDDRSTGKPLKTAYELAMERLERADRDRGVEPAKPLSEEQKETIARLRADARAKTAEVEILKRDRISKAEGDRSAIAEIESDAKRDIDRIESRLESGIARVHRGLDPYG